MLEIDGVNLKVVVCVESVDFTQTCLNGCVDVFNVLGIEGTCTAIMKELCSVIECDGCMSTTDIKHCFATS